MTEREPDAEAAPRAVETAARDSYGRLMAYLAARWRDVSAVEDALAEAFAAALRTWPESGVPQKPEAWLLAAAHRRMIDLHRHRRVRAEVAPEIVRRSEELLTLSESAQTLPDERLALLFVCAHPAIAEDVRTPLMLQTVLGLDAARIAAAFLVSPATMGQRLVRAKVRIRDAGIGFRRPDPEEWPERLEAVLETIYAAYGAGWSDLSAADPTTQGLAGEAITLGRILVRQVPDDPEAGGLLALMLHCEARRPARRDERGAFVPLADQDPRRWQSELVREAETLLRTAARVGRPGRFQLEAAIQSAHAARAHTGRTDWPAIAILYRALVAHAPTVGAVLGQAAALEHTEGATTALALIDTLPSDRVKSHQPYWALRAHLLKAAGHRSASQSARQQAIGLTTDPTVRAFLLAQSE